MPTKQHHYVPKSYLRRFASKPKRINIFNLQRRIAREDVSIKDQCRKRNYYGDQGIEDALGDLETEAAKAIKSLIIDPEPSLSQTILQFVAVQHVRTPASVNSAAAMLGKMFQLTASTGLGGTNHMASDVESLVTPAFVLSMADEVTNAIADLNFRVLSHPKSVFITSDNPVFFYNQYCEQAQNTGITGATRIGLQIFAPLSPRHLLMLFDGGTYDYIKSRTLTDSDIETLNGLQVLSAARNVYFDDWHQLGRVTALVDRFAHLRAGELGKAEEIASDQNENESLIHGYLEVPNVGLNLSVLRIKKRALRTSMDRRLNGTRIRTRKPRRPNRNTELRTYSKVVARI